MRNSTRLLLAAAVLAAAAPAFAESAAYLAAASGSVQVTVGGRPLAATVGQPLPAGAQVRTGGDGSAVVMTSDGAKIQLRADTVFVFEEQTPARTMLSLLRGGFSAWVRSLGDRRLNVRAPGAVASVRGTVFTVTTDGRTSFFDLFRGEIAVTDAFGRTSIATPGQRVSASAERGLVGTSSLPPSAGAPEEPSVPAPSAGKPGKTAAKKPEEKPQAPAETPSAAPAPAPIAPTPSPTQETIVVSPSAP